MLFRPTCGQGSQAEVWTPAPPPASLPASPHSLIHFPEALGTKTSALVEPGGEGPETDSKHARLAVVWAMMNAGKRRAGEGRAGRAGKGRVPERSRSGLMGEATAEGGPPSGVRPGEHSSSFTPIAPGGRPTQRSEDGEPLHWRAGQRKPRPALGYPRAPRSPRLGSHRLPSCLECGTCAPEQRGCGRGPRARLPSP